MCFFICSGPGDYEDTVISLTFGPGMSFATVDVPIVNDTLYENDEVFYGNLRLPAGAVNGVEFDPMRANATIIDDDSELYSWSQIEVPVYCLS